ncbi:hypothetical protein PO909_016349, partial [Leuciscus waleckii]
QFRQAPSSPWIHLCRSSTFPHLWTELLWLSLVPSSPRLYWTPHSLQFLLCPHSLCLHHAHLCPRLHLSHQSRSSAQSSALPGHFGSPAPPWSPLPPAPTPSVGPLESSALPPPWLLPPSSPPWPSAQSAPPWPPPPSAPPWSLLPSVCPHPLFVLLLSPLPPSAVSPSTVRGCAYWEGGVMSQLCSV